jgi:shikimate kinase
MEGGVGRKARPESFRNIILTGFMGCGKTTVGRIMARRLGWIFLDLDREIERRAGMSIPAIFRGWGERAFREMEHRAIKGLVWRTRVVAAAGGGAPMTARNRAWLKRAGAVVYLKVPIRVLAARLGDGRNRPLLDPAGGDRDAVYALVGRLLRIREKDYRRAEFTVNAGALSPAHAAGRVLRALARRA